MCYLGNVLALGWLTSTLRTACVSSSSIRCKTFSAITHTLTCTCPVSCEAVLGSPVKLVVTRLPFPGDPGASPPPPELPKGLGNACISGCKKIRNKRG